MKGSGSLLKSRGMSVVLFCMAVIPVAMLTACGCSSDQIRIPVKVENCANLGSLQASIRYDASILQIKEVKPVDIGEDAMVEINVDTPGIIIFGMIDSSGMSGNGDIAELHFDVISDGGTSQVSLDNVRANDATTLVDLPSNIIAGEYRDGEITSLSIVFNQ